MALSPEKKKRFEELAAMLPPELRSRMLENPEAFTAVLKQEIATRKKHYPSIDFVPNIGQEKALKCLSMPHETYGDYPHKIFILGGNGCIGGETKFFDYNQMKTVSIQECKTLGVVSYRDHRFKIDTAFVVKSEKKTPLYRIKTKSSELVCNDDHVLLCRGRWRRLKNILVGETIFASRRFLQGSILDTSLSALFSGVVRSMKKAQDFLSNCSAYFCLYGEQLRMAEASALGFVPSQDGAQKHSLFFWQKDDRAEVKDDSRRDQWFLRFCRNDLSALSFLQPAGMEFCGGQMIFEQPCSSHPQFHQFLSRFFLLLQDFVSSAQNLLCGAYTFLLCRVWLNIHTRSLRSQELILKEFLREDFYYDLIVPGNNSYLAGGFVNHNSGKTCDLAAVLLPGICLGPEFVNRTYCNWRFFYDCAEIRKKRKLLVRLIGAAADMMEGAGSLYQQISKWIPTAEFKNKAGDFFKTIQIGDVLVDFKTHEMSVVAHAGPDYDVVIFNEPPPEPIYKENLSRTRGVGRAFVFCTPLKLAAYLLRETDAPAPDGEISVNYISLWDACADIPGTRGHKSRVEIERQIRDWQSDPDSLEARVFGKFQHLAGAIFKCFDEAVHKIQPFPIDKNFNVYMVVDPHLAKPPFVIWVAVDALGRAFVVAEYPIEDWDTINSTSLTIEHFGKDFDLIEHGKHPQFQYFNAPATYNIGDPNIMGTRMPNTNRTLKQEYDKATGRSFITNVNDSIELGFDRIRELIFFDKTRPVSAVNQPKLYVFETCKNTLRALREFGTTDDKTVWECPIACLRYFAMKQQPWESKAGGDYGVSEYDAINRGRNAEYMKAVA